MVSEDRQADGLSTQAILALLDSTLIGRTLSYSPEMPSTNEEARHLAKEGAPEGTVVVADYQTAGRGRLGRSWVAPPGSSLLFSIIFRPSLVPQQLQRLTMLCGLAVLDALLAETGLDAGLKWPNDIVLRGEKLGGILAELELSGERLEYAVVGLGLNVNLDPKVLPSRLLVPATSVSEFLGRPVRRLPLLVAILRAIEARYLDLKAGRSPCQEWSKHLVTLGQPVSVTAGPATLTGVAEAVDDDGALLVRTPDGRLETVRSADVTTRTER